MRKTDGAGDDAGGLVPVARELPAAERFELAAGDHLRRLEVAARDAVIREALAAAGALESARALAAMIAEHKHEVVAPLGEKAAFLVERQGELIRATKARLEDALAKLARLEKVQDERGREEARWRERFQETHGMTVEAAVLKAESARELKRWKSGESEKS